MAATDPDAVYLRYLQAGCVDGMRASFPDFTQTWMGTTMYPVGRGQDRRAASGWTCPGCGHSFSPAMRECTYCPVAAAGPVPDCGAMCRCCPEDEL